MFPTRLAPLPDGTIKFRLLFEKDQVLNMATNLDDLAAVAQLQRNEQEIQGNVEREIKKLKFYISQISSFVADEDYEKLKRLLEPSRLLCQGSQGRISPYKFLAPCLSVRVKFTNQ